MLSKIADFLHLRVDNSDRLFDIGIHVTIDENGHDLSARVVKVLASSVDEGYKVSQIFDAPFHVWRPREDDGFLIRDAFISMQHHAKGLLSPVPSDGHRAEGTLKTLEEAFKVVGRAKALCLKIDVNDCTELLKDLLKLIPPVPCSELYLKHIVDVEDYGVFELLVRRLRVPGLSLLKPYSLNPEIVKPIVDLYLYQTTEKWTLKKLVFYSNTPFKKLESILTTSQKTSVQVIGDRTISIDFE
ncbi:hypothetical protein QR680_006321 [Steinernema hermaphroditum]|uniref:Uncharacterized protein n=1 Tax=Steinernema hermaphroditum TaxID=289476 RepID=A0AA39HWJ5_9BILA|nr:hypothetical protein QR680_006321 [Steinernema hermaphroditum]